MKGLAFASDMQSKCHVFFWPLNSLDITMQRTTGIFVGVRQSKGFNTEGIHSPARRPPVHTWRSPLLLLETYNAL